MTKLLSQRRLAIIAVGLFCLTGSVVFAQSTSIEIRSGEVLSVKGNTLIVRGPEGVKQIVVPDDFRFDLDGRKVSVHELKPGTKLTALIRTRETPIDMNTTEVKEAEVVHTVGNTVVVRMQDGEIKKFSPTTMKADDVMLFDRNGDPISAFDLKKGQKITATIVTKAPPTTMTARDVQVLAQNPPKPQPRPATPIVAEVRRQPEPAPVVLPKTGSLVPLAGLSGLLFLAVGAGSTILRRLR